MRSRRTARSIIRYTTFGKVEQSVSSLIDGSDAASAGACDVVNSLTDARRKRAWRRCRRAVRRTRCASEFSPLQNRASDVRKTIDEGGNRNDDGQSDTLIGVAAYPPHTPFKRALSPYRVKIGVDLDPATESPDVRYLGMNYNASLMLPVLFPPTVRLQWLCCAQRQRCSTTWLEVGGETGTGVGRRLMRIP